MAQPSAEHETSAAHSTPGVVEGCDVWAGAAGEGQSPEGRSGLDVGREACGNVKHRASIECLDHQFVDRRYCFVVST